MYNDIPDKRTSWEDCSLRVWLNGAFLDSVFSSEEQSMILWTDLDNTNSNGLEKGVDGGNNTSDRIFLLSYEETRRYLTDDNIRICVPTKSAVHQGAFQSSKYSLEGLGTTLWWTRSPGKNQRKVAVINSKGEWASYYAYSTDVAVRPALWVDFSRQQ